MANQSPDRRRVLELLATAAVASQFPGFSRWVFAAQHQHGGATHVQPRPANYQPQFFDPAEYRTIHTLAELIVPTDDTPGATEAGVSEFIDFMAAHGDPNLGLPMRTGLQWLARTANQTGGKAFNDLSPEAQTQILKSVAYKNVGSDPQGQAFFQLIRRYTVMGYYTSRVGLESLNYPGLQFYSQSPACPHKDDPEHRHLPPPRF